jgi:DNA-directed RNA polymerase alpha subunit
MKQDDLTCLKHVGSSRMNFLYESGIRTIKQLHDIPLEKLAQVKSIGDYYARQIKNSVSDHYRGKSNHLANKPASFGRKKPEDINRDLKKKVKRLRKILNRVDENLKPLWKKKYLKLYVDFKKRLAKLRSRLMTLVLVMDDLTDEEKKNIIEQTDALILKLKNVGTRPKKKKYKVTILEIQSFSKFLKDIFSEF